MTSRTLRLTLPAASAAIFAIACGASALAHTIHPDPTCVEPSPCDPISPITVLLILVKIFSLI